MRAAEDEEKPINIGFLDEYESFMSLNQEKFVHFRVRHSLLGRPSHQLCSFPSKVVIIDFLPDSSAEPAQHRLSTPIAPLSRTLGGDVLIS